MLHLPINGHQIFEVFLFNREVRSLVKENQSHDFFDDQWADVQIRDVTARDETHARQLIEERFPPGDGFVIEEVTRTEV